MLALTFDPVTYKYISDLDLWLFIYSRVMHYWYGLYVRKL